MGDAMPFCGPKKGRGNPYPRRVQFKNKLVRDFFKSFVWLSCARWRKKRTGGTAAGTATSNGNYHSARDGGTAAGTATSNGNYHSAGSTFNADDSST